MRRDLLPAEEAVVVKLPLEVVVPMVVHPPRLKPSSSRKCSNNTAVIPPAVTWSRTPANPWDKCSRWDRCSTSNRWVPPTTLTGRPHRVRASPASGPTARHVNLSFRHALTHRNSTSTSEEGPIAQTETYKQLRR